MVRESAESVLLSLAGSRVAQPLAGAIAPLFPFRPLRSDADPRGFRGPTGRCDSISLRPWPRCSGRVCTRSARGIDFESCCHCLRWASGLTVSERHRLAHLQAGVAYRNDGQPSEPVAAALGTMGMRRIAGRPPSMSTGMGISGKGASTLTATATKPALGPGTSPAKRSFRSSGPAPFLHVGNAGGLPAIDFA